MIYVNSLTVSPARVTLVKGNWYYDLSANVLPVNATCPFVHWTSDNPSVASVNQDTGFVYANATGTANIVAYTLDGSGLAAICAVTVTQQENTAVTITPAQLSMYVGEAYTLSATVTPAQAASKGVIWSSTNKNIVQVNHASGLISACAEGTALIHATAQDGSEASASCTVTVYPFRPVTSVTVTPSTYSMEIGAEARLSATVLPSNASNQTLRWSSTNSSVVAVDEDTGDMVALSDGIATIRATTTDGTNLHDSCRVTVTAPEPQISATIIPESLTLYPGQTALLYANICPDSECIKVYWFSEAPSIASINKETGFLYAHNPGTTNICLGRKDENVVLATCTVTVLPETETDSVVVSPVAEPLAIGETVQLRATVLPTDLTNKTVLWSSSDPSIATVSTSGLVTAVQNGTVNITAISQNTPAISGSCTVQIQPETD